MTAQNILNVAMSAFKQKFTDFCKINDCRFDDHLDAGTLKKLTNALMAAAGASGNAGLTEYLQSHDKKAATVRFRDTTYRYKGISEKTFLTLFGEVVVNRSIYGNGRCGTAYHVPLDAALGLENDDYATWETREMILFAASSASPTDVERLLRKTCFCNPSDTAVQNIITRDGKRMELHRTEIADTVQQKQVIPPDAAVFVASLDGANILLREKGIKKGRKTQRPVDADDGGESPTAFRNAMVGSFSLYGNDTEDGRPQRICSNYIARMPQEKAVVFKEDFERVIRYYNVKHTGERILLCDGFRSIWKYAQQCPELSGYRHLIDFFHVTEHLSRAAEAIFGASSSQATWWYDKWREALLSDPRAPGAIIRSIEGYRERFKFTKSRLKELQKELTFFKRNKQLMTYAEFRKRGFPIGSGPVEAAAKVLVKQRMCRSGMRWSRSGGQYVLTLRAYMKSGTWDEMWNAYQTIRQAA